MTILFALLTALANAVSLATQHIASTSTPKHASGWRLLSYLLRHPLWLFGWVALTASLIFHAVALHFGPMSEVQPLLVTELVIALVLRRVWVHQTIRTITWLSAVVTTVSLVLFLVEAAPQATIGVPRMSSWWGPIVVCVIAVGALIIAASRGSAHRRAAMFASATGILWALEATFIKATTDTLTSYGVGGSLTRWPLYAFVIGGVIGLACEQAALHLGPLNITQPLIVIVDPIVSVALGLWLYRERIDAGVLHLVVAGLAFAAMSAGVVVLTRTAPTSMRADGPRT